MPPKTTAKKGVKGIKGRSKSKAKKTVQQMSDSDTLLGPDRPEQRPEGSEHEDGEEGEEARERQAPEATQEEADSDEEDGAPARKRVHVSDTLSVVQEQDLVDFFSENPLFYDQTMKEFKKRGKRDHMLDTKGKEMGCNIKPSSCICLKRIGHFSYTIW